MITLFNAQIRHTEHKLTRNANGHAYTVLTGMCMCEIYDALLFLHPQYKSHVSMCGMSSNVKVVAI